MLGPLKYNYKNFESKGRVGRASLESHYNAGHIITPNTTYAQQFLPEVCVSFAIILENKDSILAETGVLDLALAR